MGYTESTFESLARVCRRKRVCNVRKMEKSRREEDLTGRRSRDHAFHRQAFGVLLFSPVSAAMLELRRLGTQRSAVTTYLRLQSKIRSFGRSFHSLLFPPSIWARFIVTLIAIPPGLSFEVTLKIVADTHFEHNYIWKSPIGEVTWEV